MYLGVGATMFDRARADGLISPPKVLGGRLLFDIRDLDAAFDALPTDGVPTSLTWKTA